MTPESLQAVADEGRILPSVRALAKTAIDTGYTSVYAWLKEITSKELSILGNTGPRVNLPMNQKLIAGKMDGKFLTISKEDLEDLQGDDLSLYSFRIAAAILAKTAAVVDEDEDRLDQATAQDMLNVLLFWEAVRRRAKIFSFTGRDLNLDSSLFTDMVSRRVRLKDDYEDHAEAKESLRHIQKALDSLQIMTRCRSRKEYLPPHLADDLGVPLDYFVSPDKYGMKALGVTLPSPWDEEKSSTWKEAVENNPNEKVVLVVIPRNDHSDLANELREKYPSNPLVAEDPKYAQYVRELSPKEREEFLRGPSDFIKKLVEDAGEKFDLRNIKVATAEKDDPVWRDLTGSKIEIKPPTRLKADSNLKLEPIKPRTIVDRLKAVWAALR